MYRLKIFLAETFYKLTLWVFNVLSFCIPKKKNFYGFYPLHDTTKLSGNIKAMLLYIKDNHKNIECVVITKNEKVQKELKCLGLKSRAPFAGFCWTLLRAEFIFIDASVTQILVNSKLSIVQLWHGVGFKNIALLNDNVTDNTRNLLAKFYRKYKLLISSSDNDLKKKKDSFMAPNIKITGSPRNDIFFSRPSYSEEIKKKYDLEPFTRIITYAPTYRDFETTPPFSESFWLSLQEHLQNENEVFVVKKHPWEKYLNVPENLANIKDVSSVIADPQELLFITDLLISDYSSITTDFSLMDRPILIYAYDFEIYKNSCRSIYYNLEEILPKPFVHSEGELLKKIENVHWLNDETYKDSYKNFKITFHKYNDGNSSQRVMNEVLKIKGR